MELRYETAGTGYIITSDGKPWIVQDNYIPYPGETLEESAQNHINAVLDELVKTETPEEDFLDFKKIEIYFKEGYWNKQQLERAVQEQKITIAEFTKITGEPYTA